MKASFELCKLFRNTGEPKDLPKKHTLLQQGEISKHAYFVESGCLRLWYNDEGNDVSVKFFLTGELVASLVSFYLEQPSKFGIETIVPSVVRIATKQTFLNQFDQSPHFRDYMFSVSVHCMSDYQDLFLNRIMNNPESRYRQLTEQDPRLLEIVPQHYLASYLGITPVSLSRIRKKISNH